MNRLYSAYLGLLLAPPSGDGSRTVSLARFGTFEVRLIELADRGMADFWIELYCHYTRSSLDSCKCRELDDAEPIADHLIFCARQLNHSCTESSCYLQ